MQCSFLLFPIRSFSRDLPGKPCRPIFEAKHPATVVVVAVAVVVTHTDEAADREVAAAAAVVGCVCLR
jgi:hypothetical protein